MTAIWLPQIGDAVWLNYPDGPDEPFGNVVDYVPENHVRAGQPIVRKTDGKFVAIAPMFLLPFPLGGEEWQRAHAEGRIGG